MLYAYAAAARQSWRTVRAMTYAAWFCPAFPAFEGLRLPIQNEIPPHELLTATAVSLYTQRMSKDYPLARVAHAAPVRWLHGEAHSSA